MTVGSGTRSNNCGTTVLMSKLASNYYSVKTFAPPSRRDLSRGFPDSGDDRLRRPAANYKRRLISEKIPDSIIVVGGSIIIGKYRDGRGKDRYRKTTYLHYYLKRSLYHRPHTHTHTHTFSTDTILDSRLRVSATTHRLYRPTLVTHTNLHTHTKVHRNRHGPPRVGAVSGFGERRGKKWESP